MPFEIKTLKPEEVKKKSEKIILNAEGEILDWLPTIELPKPRPVNKVINRALILNALFQLSLNAPKNYINRWIENNFLISELTPKELNILTYQGDLTDEEQYNLYWSLESLWAIAWATNVVPELSFNKPVGSELAKLSPNLQTNEGGHKYLENMRLRPIDELFEMLDLYYRLHWWTQTAHRVNKSTGDVSLEVIIWRRKALEWMLNRDSSWDEMDLSI